MSEGTGSSKDTPTLTGQGKQDISGEVEVAVVDDAIVTMPGTSHCVSYRKIGNAPWLVASDISDDRDSRVGRFVFRARAWSAADEKARKLGWIV